MFGHTELKLTDVIKVVFHTFDGPVLSVFNWLGFQHFRESAFPFLGDEAVLCVCAGRGLCDTIAGTELACIKRGNWNFAWIIELWWSPKGSNLIKQTIIIPLYAWRRFLFFPGNKIFFNKKKKHPGGTSGLFLKVKLRLPCARSHCKHRWWWTL